jgi:hypothetical protein
MRVCVSKHGHLGSKFQKRTMDRPSNDFTIDQGFSAMALFAF